MSKNTKLDDIEITKTADSVELGKATLKTKVKFTLDDKAKADLSKLVADCLPEEAEDPIKRGELIQCDGKNRVEMHWLRKAQDNGYNQALTDIKKALREKGFEV